MLTDWLNKEGLEIQHAHIFSLCVHASLTGEQGVGQRERERKREREIYKERERESGRERKRERE